MMQQEVEKLAEFEIIGVLGYGANTTIYSAKDPKDGKVCAIKRVVLNDPSEQRFVDQVQNEYKIAKLIGHPILRQVYELRKVRKMFTVKEVLLVMELVEGKNLVRQRPNSMAALIRVFIDTASGLDAMHRAGYLHADMKPNNILLTPEGKTKVIDYGQSCVIGTVKNRIQGTPDYIAPEQVKRRKLTPETDIYNLGASLYWCLTDTHIPTLIPKDPTKTKFRIRNINLEEELIPPSELVPAIPAPLNNLIIQCLRTRPDERPGSMGDVKNRLDVIAALLDRNGQSSRDD